VSRGKLVVPSSLGIHRAGVRGKRADPNNLGIHCPEDRSKRGIPNGLGIHSPTARSRDIRIRDIRRLGSRNRCPVAVEVYSQLPRISRLPLRSLLRGRLPARAELVRVKGELLLLQGAPGTAAAAEDHFRQALDWARRQGALSWELRAATSLARLLRDRDRIDEARDLLYAQPWRLEPLFMPRITNMLPKGEKER
jgi:hypothetical protein